MAVFLFTNEYPSELIWLFYGEKLLTTGNQDAENDQALFKKLGIRPEERVEVPSSRRMVNA